MTDRRLTVLRQYNLRERAPLVLTVACQRLGFALDMFVRRRLAGYAETKAVFDDVTHSGRGVEKRGTENWVEWADEELGELRVGLRRGSSDFATFLQVFREKQYRPVARVARAVLPGGVATIVDAGANIGLATLYFKRQFPEARVVAVEAESGNHAACARNLAANGVDDAVVLHRALWADESELALGAWQDGREWAFTVAPHGLDAAGRLGTVEGISLETLMAEQRLERIDILKIDIEGAESELFASPERSAAWLPKVSIIALEIHSPEAEALIVPQLRSAGFFVFTRGELTIGVCEKRADCGTLLDFFASSP